MEKTKTSSQYFQPVQKFAVQEIGLVLLPVESQEQAASLIGQMVRPPPPQKYYLISNFLISVKCLTTEKFSFRRMWSRDRKAILLCFATRTSNLMLHFWQPLEQFLDLVKSKLRPYCKLSIVSHKAFF